MKKNFFLIGLIFLFAFGATAQSDFQNSGGKPAHAPKKGAPSINMNTPKTALTENFEGTFPPSFWNLTTGTGDWTQSTDVDHTTGTGNAAIYDCYNIEGTDPAYLTTPTMAVTAGDTLFTFWCNYYLVSGTWGNASKLCVDKSTNGGITWTTDTTNYLSTITLDTWTQFTINLSANIGQNVKIRFKAISDYGSYNIAIDDINGPALNISAHDLGVTAVTPLGFVLTGSTVTPHVSVYNYGSSDEATYSVSLSDGASYNQTVNSAATLLSLGSVDLTFPNWTPADANYTLTAVVTVASDAFVANDTMRSLVQVRPYACGDIVDMDTTKTASAIGIETDGLNIYVQHWNDTIYERYDMDFNFINNFSIGAASSARDLAYDGTNFYGAPNSTSLFKLDFTAGAEALVSTITAPTACRAIAYDSDDNTFWGNSGTGIMQEFSTAGVATGRSFTPTVGIYGAAYDHYSDPATPTIWGSDWSGGLSRLVEWTLSGTETGRVIDLTSVIPGGDAGGLAIYDDGVNAYILADFQTAPNTMVKIFLKKLPTSTDYIVDFSVVGSNGTLAATVDGTAITSPDTIAAGKNVIFTATPDANYQVKEWKKNGVVIAGNTTNNYTLTNLMANSTVTVEFESNIGINAPEADQFNIYPNPANDMVSIFSNTTINNIAVVNINGQVVLESTIDSKEATLNTANLNSGIYFLRIANDHGISMKKIQIIK